VWKARGGEGNAIGYVPTPGSLTLDGLKVSRESVEELLRVDAHDWTGELEEVKAFFGKFGDELPAMCAAKS